MSWSRRRLLTGLSALPLLGLAGCGFRPLYASAGPGKADPMAEMAAIRISPLSGRTGQILHNKLRDALNPHGQPHEPRYQLVVSLRERRSGLGVRLDETATRARLEVRAKFKLTGAPNTPPLVDARAQSFVSFNLLESEFATYVAENDARERALSEIAEEIRLRLAGYFQTQAAAAE